jgi:glutamate dehydrogenase (NADP+)
MMAELYHYIGENLDVPAGDIGVGSREIGALYGYYKKLTGRHDAAFTGRGVAYGGSHVRKEATGYGLVYITEEMLKTKGEDFKDKKVVISGSGNVSIYAAEKAIQRGAKVVAMSDSNGYIFDENGVDLEVVKRIKEVERGRIGEYINSYPKAKYVSDWSKIWEINCDIALPCATQNELGLDAAKALKHNKVKAVAEGANMPATLEAAAFFVDNNIPYLPAKAANAGGVATSLLEMAQSASHIYQPFAKVDERLKLIMTNIFNEIRLAADSYGLSNNYVAGANIAGFKRVADAMMLLGVV